MKIKKILIYITAAAAAFTMASAAYAEDDGIAPLLDFIEEEDTTSEPAESTDNSDTTEFEPIILPIVSDSTDSDTAEPTDTEETSSDTQAVDVIEFDTDPADETSSEESTESTDSTDESTTEPDILWEDTTSAPEISLGTDPEPVTDPPTEATTAAPTEPPATEPPATDPTEASTEEPVTLDTQSSATTVSEASIATSENDTTTTPVVLTTPSDFDGGNIAGVDPAGSDDLLTTILWIVAGVLAFVLILVLPPVIRRIRKNIIYKYD